VGDAGGGVTACARELAIELNVVAKEVKVGVISQAFPVPWDSSCKLLTGALEVDLDAFSSATKKPTSKS
jgi:hypothetical protein